MGETRMVDTSLGISRFARALLAVLDCSQFTINDAVEIRTAAWYNGRETGCVLYVPGKRDTLIITFGEVRNVDSIFVDAWRSERRAWINPPTVADFDDKAYAGRRSFLRFDDAAVYVADKVTEYLRAERYQ